MQRRRLLIDFQKDLSENFPDEDYNVFIFGSFIRQDFDAGNSDIDIIVYCMERPRSYRIVKITEAFFRDIIECDIIEYVYMPEAYVYVNGILNAFKMTDYFPQQLKNEMYVITRHYEKHMAEQRDREKYMEWFHMYGRGE